MKTRSDNGDLLTKMLQSFSTALRHSRDSTQHRTVLLRHAIAMLEKAALSFRNSAILAGFTKAQVEPPPTSRHCSVLFRWQLALCQTCETCTVSPRRDSRTETTVAGGGSERAVETPCRTSFRTFEALVSLLETIRNKEPLPNVNASKESARTTVLTDLYREATIASFKVVSELVR